MESIAKDGTVKEHLECYGAWDDEELKDHGDKQKSSMESVVLKGRYENPFDYDYLYLRLIFNLDSMTPSCTSVRGSYYL